MYSCSTRQAVGDVMECHVKEDSPFKCRRAVSITRAHFEVAVVRDPGVAVAAEARHPSSSGLNVETLTVHNVLRGISMISCISTFGPVAERWRTTHEMPNRMVGGDTKACGITVNSAYTGGWKTSPPCVEWRENITIVVS